MYSNTLALTSAAMLEVLGSTIAKRDRDTNVHNCRVTLCSVRLGEKWEHGEETVAGSAWLKDAEEVLHGHHERFDGVAIPGDRRGGTVFFWGGEHGIHKLFTIDTAPFIPAV